MSAALLGAGTECKAPRTERLAQKQVFFLRACVVRILRSSEPEPAHETDTHDGNDGKKSSKGEKNVPRG